MAIFDLRCTFCKATEMDVALRSDEAIPICKDCGHPREKVWIRPPKGYVFKAGYYEHLGLEPVYVGSKAQLRAECNERGLYSDYAN